MKNEAKEIEHQLRQTLETWSDVLNELNDENCVLLDFSNEDVLNALNIINFICGSIGIKNGTIRDAKDAERINKNVKHLMDDCFGINITDDMFQ